MFFFKHFFIKFVKYCGGAGLKLLLFQRLGTRKKLKLHLWVSWVIKLTEHSILHSYSNSWKHLCGTLFMQWCLNLSQEKCIRNPSFPCFIILFFFFFHRCEMIWRSDILFKNISSLGDLGAASIIKLVPKSYFHLLTCSLQSAVDWKAFTMSKFSFITRRNVKLP